MAEETEKTPEQLESEMVGDDFFVGDGSGTTGSNSDSVGGFGGTEYYAGAGNQNSGLQDLVNKAKNGATSYGTSEVKWNPYASDKVLGLPLYYNDLCDPNGRVYNNTIINDIPHIYIIPGLPSINRNLIDSAGKRIIPATLSRMILDAKESMINFGVRGIKTGEDLRFIGFKPDYREYYNYVQVMLSAIYSYLDNTKALDLFRFSDDFENSLSNFGLCFYGDKSTSISEDASNTYAPSKVAEMVSQNANTLREADILNPAYGVTARLVDSLKAANPLGILDAMGTFDGIISRTSNALFRVVNGSQLMFPEMWQDSSFDRSYNLSFKFYSPYGDKMSIFRYVYVPFISLLALALPRQDGLLGYKRPFLLKVSSPGYFEIDMGVVTSMTITKGGSDGLWTIDGLPQMIEVNMQVMDLYPNLIQVDKEGLLSYNSTLSSFLENMAGIRPDQLNFMLRAKALIQRKLSNSFIFGIPENIEHGIEDFIHEVQGKIIGGLLR
jgi:hypothetical protein